MIKVSIRRLTVTISRYNLTTSYTLKRNRSIGRIHGVGYTLVKRRFCSVFAQVPTYDLDAVTLSNVFADYLAATPISPLFIDMDNSLSYSHKAALTA